MCPGFAERRDRQVDAKPGRMIFRGSFAYASIRKDLRAFRLSAAVPAYGCDVARSRAVTSSGYPFELLSTEIASHFRRNARYIFRSYQIPDGFVNARFGRTSAMRQARKCTLTSRDLRIHWRAASPIWAAT